MNLWAIFLTGLTIGGLTCLAVQGGLLASVITTRENEAKENSKARALYATMVFIISKLVAYTALGFLLGAFGNAINFSGNMQTLMQMAAGVYMIVVALNLLEVHPIFRYAIIQPPKFLTRIVKNQSKSKDIFAPAILGAMTIFIPCGTTLAMEVLAISSANAIMGAAIMASFILGTIPLFFGLGALTSFLGEKFQKRFYKVAAVIVFSLGLVSINGALIALGSPISSQTLSGVYQTMFVVSNNNDGVKISQNPEIVISSSGYGPGYIRVEKGKEVNLKLVSKDAYSCASAFRIPALGIAVNLQPNEEKTVKFTPEMAGKILFTCSMGMYQGTIEVI